MWSYLAAVGSILLSSTFDLWCWRREIASLWWGIVGVVGVERSMFLTRVSWLAFENLNHWDTTQHPTAYTQPPNTDLSCDRSPYTPLENGDFFRFPPSKKGGLGGITMVLELEIDLCIAVVTTFRTPKVPFFSKDTVEGWGCACWMS
jgi:hypothetical protein